MTNLLTGCLSDIKRQALPLGIGAIAGFVLGLTANSLGAFVSFGPLLLVLICLAPCLAPILLLDEIAAHLDARRRAALFDEIHDLSAQAWMTGTDLSLFSEAKAEIFEVRDGVFQSQEMRA